MYNPQELTTLINTVGFPIVAFLLMFWLTRTTVRDNTKAIIELKESIVLTNNRQTNTIRQVEDNETYCTQ